MAPPDASAAALSDLPRRRAGAGAVALARMSNPPVKGRGLSVAAIAIAVIELLVLGAAAWWLLRRRSARDQGSRSRR
jgi:hypothetical protein